MWRACLLLIPPILLASCFGGGGPEFLPMRKEAGLEGAWAFAGAHVDATDERILVNWQGKVYEFRGIPRFLGAVAEERVEIVWDRNNILLDRETLIIQMSKGPKIMRALAELPPRPIVVFEKAKFYFIDDS